MVGWNGSLSWTEEMAASFFVLDGTKDCESETNGTYWSSSWSDHDVTSNSFALGDDMSVRRLTGLEP